MPNWNNDNNAPNIQAMNIPQKYAPMMEMPQEQLEAMYPRCYYIIHPEVCRHCDNFVSQFGNMYTPSRQQLDEMVDNIDNSVGEDVDADYRDEELGYDDYYGYEDGYSGSYEYYDEREPDGYGGGFGGGFGGRRRFRRDLISILLLRELLRRRRPYYGYPGGHGWY